MDQRLLSAEISLQDLLSGHYAFAIPPFQRDYSWSREEALQLLDDLVSAADDVERAGSDTPYFLGTMLFVAADATRLTEDASVPMSFGVDVVDGQQRLITLTILFAILRDMTEDESERAALSSLIATPTPAAYPYQLKLKPADAQFFVAAILTPDAAKVSQKKAAIAGDVARNNIEVVRRTLHQRLIQQHTPQARSRLARFARENVRVLVVTASDFDYAYQIFLTINDRGKRLSVEDIFRGEILGPLDAAQRERFSTVVEEMDKYMDAEEKRRSKGKTFFTHLSAAYAWSGMAIVSGLRRAVAARGGPKRFAAEVFAPMAEAYLAIKSAGASLPPGERVEELRHWLTALAWLERHGDDDWVGVAMVALTRMADDPPKLIRFLAALDRFAHGLLALGCGRSGRQKIYAPVLAALTADVLPSDPAALLSLQPQDEVHIVRSMATRLHMLDSQTARVVLLRLDAMISDRPLSYYAPLLAPEVPSGERLTVEHVLPRGDVDGGTWVELFPRKNRRRAIAQSIGNLVLISEQANRAASQLDFTAKKRAYFGTEPGPPHPLLLTEQLREIESWDGQAITERYELLTQALFRLWKFDGPVPRLPLDLLDSQPESRPDTE